ncbi:MAG TPA: ADP-ribosylglycohydrolase family protein [bacterium]|nr:ADP-ribosylglycohydrolase family protein [bacterium]HQL60970.1 ADP-ribosylglycohydrolase family protein [bacterium]
MFRRTALLFVCFCLFALNGISACSDPLRPMPLNTYIDKLKGGWAGQMIGVSYGAPYEFRSEGKIDDGEIREWKPEYIDNSIDQDDLYVEMTFLQAIEAKGIGLSARDAGWFFRDSKYDLWHANRAARDNLRLGIPAPKSGHPKYNRHADDIDFQIESDLFGLLCPGMPLAAQDFCNRFGHIMNYGDGVYGGMFVTAMGSVAFFENNVVEIVRAGYRAIPAESEYGMLIKDVLDCYEKDPNNWRACWELLEKKWAPDDICGANNPFNIDAKLNGGYVAIGLLWGKGDWDKTLEIATRCGQDSDCNPSSAAAILGIISGYSQIPAKFTAGIPAIADRNFSYTNYNFHTLADTCAQYAKQVVTKYRGKITTENGNIVLHVAAQDPTPPKKLEQFTDAMVEEYKPFWSKHDAAIRADRLKMAVKEWNPEWELVDCGQEMNPGLRKLYMGREKVLVTHPLNRETPAVLKRTVTIPKDSRARLRLVVTHHIEAPESDWQLRVIVNGELIGTERIAGQKEQSPWKTLEYDLKPYAGKKVTIRLENAANDWKYEAAYWAMAEVLF